MPRRIFAARRVVARALDALTARRLLAGRGIPPSAWGPEHERETFENNMRAAWSAHRDELVTAWTSIFPSTRPHGWWTFDATEPRRRLSGPGSNAARLAVDAGRPARLSFGIPAAFVKADIDNPTTYETEAAYLDRLGLLTDAERAAIAELPLADRVARVRAAVPSTDALPVEAALVALGFAPFRAGDLPPAERAAYLEFCRAFDCPVSDAPPTPYQSPLAVTSDDESMPDESERLTT